MYEYWFLGLTDDQDSESEPFDHTGTTYDFLEIVCNVSRAFTPKVAGEFIESLAHENADQLSFLRVIDWKFVYVINDDQTIRLHHTPR